MTTIREFQELMKRMYFHRDEKRGAERTMLWLLSETGEFADALVKNNKKGLQDEAADIFAWLCSECNLLGIDLEEEVLKKYSKCPRCGQEICECPENY